MFMHEESPSLGFDDSVLPNPFDHSHVFPLCLQPSPVDNPMICDDNVNLGYEDNMFSMLGGNVDNFLSLGYFCGYDASADNPRKIMWNTFFA